MASTMAADYFDNNSESILKRKDVLLITTNRKVTYFKKIQIIVEIIDGHTTNHATH